MNSEMTMGEAIVSIVVFCAILGAIGAAINYDAYRRGQIDAQEGRVKYRPTTQVVWEEAK